MSSDKTPVGEVIFNHADGHCIFRVHDIGLAVGEGIVEVEVVDGPWSSTTVGVAGVNLLELAKMLQQAHTKLVSRGG